MIIIREDYAVYHTTDSQGLDICIKDNIDRFALCPVDSIPYLIEDLKEIMLERAESESAMRGYDFLTEDW